MNPYTCISRVNTQMFDSYVLILFLWIFIPLVIMFSQGIRAYLNAKRYEKRIKLLEESDEFEV